MPRENWHPSMGKQIDDPDYRKLEDLQSDAEDLQRDIDDND
jgi:hypothetical protein